MATIIDNGNGNELDPKSIDDGNGVIIMSYDPVCYYKHYVRVDDRDRIIHIWSNGPCEEMEPEPNDYLYNDKGSYQFRFEEDGEENPPFLDFDQETMTIIPLYKYDKENNKVIRRSQSEVDADFAALDPLKLKMYQDAKVKEVSERCTETITAGCDVTLSDGSVKHISLSTYDQINLADAYNAVLNGAESILYHIDGELFTEFSADDIKIMYNTANEFKTYHRAYINHLINYIRSLTDVVEINNVNYGDSLPDSLITNF